MSREQFAAFVANEIERAKTLVAAFKNDGP
jgi:hypothetical protein